MLWTLWLTTLHCDTGNTTHSLVVHRICCAYVTLRQRLFACAHVQVDSGTWSAPDVLPGPSPGPRAFHSAVVAQDGRMLLFGGHILTFDAEHNRKRRNFFNDVWQLDLVSRRCTGVGGPVTFTD